MTTNQLYRHMSTRDSCPVEDSARVNVTVTVPQGPKTPNRVLDDVPDISGPGVRELLHTSRAAVGVYINVISGPLQILMHQLT